MVGVIILKAIQSLFRHFHNLGSFLKDGKKTEMSLHEPNLYIYFRI